MIEFKCQHCGKGLHLNDSYAGRDGWCRVCKRMVIVPGGGPISRVEDLPPEEGYERLQRLLQYAATKADKFKVHLALQAKEQEHTARLEEALLEAQRRLIERESTEARLQEEMSALVSALREKEARLSELEAAGSSVRSARDSEIEQELGMLRADLAIERDSRQRLSESLSERDAALAAIEQELASTREALSRFTALEESAAADRANLHALEGAAAALKSRLHLVETERDRLAVLLEEGSLGEEDQALRLIQKDREIDALKLSLDEAKAQQAETSRKTREQLDGLEGQLSLFDEVKERMAGLQARIRELEQERLDNSLALDSSHQSEQLLQKKIGVLEASLQASLGEQSAREMESEQLQRELAVRDEQVRKLTEALQGLTQDQGAAVLAAEKREREARALEARAERLSGEIEALQQTREEASVENEQLRRGVVELEARVVSLNESLAHARADAAAKASHEPVAAALQAELSEARLALQRAEEERAASKATLTHTVSELQAEVMNLTESLHRTESALAAAKVSEEAEGRLAELESRLEAQLALASQQQAEEERLNRTLGESQARIAELEASLSDALRRAEGADSSRADDGEDDDEDVGFILLNPEPRAGEESAQGSSPSSMADEHRRQLEKKQMMDVLSDFLNK